MTTPSQADWQRLGDLLIQRRVELGARYRYRNAFADGTGLDWRLLYDIEKARRTNFARSTIAAIEVAYRLRPGSIPAFLARDEDGLVPLPEPAPELPPRREFANPALQDIWDRYEHKIDPEVLEDWLRIGEILLQARRRAERRSA